MLPTSQAAPRPRTEGGTGVALPYLDAAINVPVDCQKRPNFKSLKGPSCNEHENYEKGMETIGEPEVQINNLISVLHWFFLGKLN